MYSEKFLKENTTLSYFIFPQIDGPFILYIFVRIIDINVWAFARNIDESTLEHYIKHYRKLKIFKGRMSS